MITMQRSRQPVSRGSLIFKGEYDAGTLTYKMDPKQVFSKSKKHTLNKYLSLFLLQ